jgi:hypothetical protein
MPSSKDLPITMLHRCCLFVNPAGSSLSYAFTVTNTGNVKLHGLQLLVPALAGNSSASSISCIYTTDGATWTGPDLAAGSSLSCAGSFSFNQDAIEASDRSPAVTATATNLAAAVSQPLPAISVPNTPSLLVTVDTTSCTVPQIAGGPHPSLGVFLQQLQISEQPTLLTRHTPELQ